MVYVFLFFIPMLIFCVIVFWILSILVNMDIQPLIDLKKIIGGMIISPYFSQYNQIHLKILDL